MCTDRYLLIKVETIVSADLSGIGNASDHPVKLSMMVRMCLFPDVDVSHPVIKSIAILLNGSVRNLGHLKWIILNFGLFSTDIACSWLYISKCLCSFSFQQYCHFIKQ